MTPERDDYAALVDAANEERIAPLIFLRWICPYCENEVADEIAYCCGECHAEPMPEGWNDGEL